MCQRKSIMAKVEVGERGQFRKIHAGFERAVGSSRATVLFFPFVFRFFFFFFYRSLSFFLKLRPLCLVFSFFLHSASSIHFFFSSTSLVLSGRRVCGSLSDGGRITNSQSSSY